MYKLHLKSTAFFYWLWMVLFSLPLSAQPAPTQYTTTRVALFTDEALSQDVGYLEAASPVRVLQKTAKASQIELTIWRKTKGFGRIGYDQFAKHITNAVLTKAFMQSKPKFEVLTSREDPLTGLVWQQARFHFWIANSELTPDLSDFWAQTESLYKEQCSVCHKQRDPKMHDANEWVAVFNGMVGFTDLEEDESKPILRYLQLHAADAGQKEE